MRGELVNSLFANIANTLNLEDAIIIRLSLAAKINFHRGGATILVFICRYLEIRIQCSVVREKENGFGYICV